MIKKQLMESNLKEEETVSGAEPKPETEPDSLANEKDDNGNTSNSLPPIENDSKLKLNRMNRNSSKRSSSKRSRGSTRLSRKISDTRKQKALAAQLQEVLNIPGFEGLTEHRVLKMGLYWTNYKIFGDGVELFQSRQSQVCSLSVTGKNELFITSPNQHNLLRIHSNIVEGLRYFHIYTNESEKYLGAVNCDVRQTFKLSSKLQNVLTGQNFTISPQHSGNVKSWLVVEDVEGDEGIELARVDASVGHRWKSFYTLTFLESESGNKTNEGGGEKRPKGLVNEILILGFVLSLASVRLESEVLPVILAISAFIITFIIFFIIQFT